MSDNPLHLSRAIRDFRQARRKAALEAIVHLLRGESSSLLPFEEVRRGLKAHSVLRRGLQEVPLDAIVGSVGRYQDFTRSFLPRNESAEERWARIKIQMTQGGGLPPIQLYQIGDAYFVLDGNHRVSVARSMGNQTIEAYVTEILTKVPLSPQDQPDDLILKIEYTDFLEQTQLDRAHPEADFSVTAPGQYEHLLHFIAQTQRELAEERKEEVPIEEAAAYWYEKRYLPVVHIIRQRGLLRDFPQRTETDLYIWLLRHRDEIEEEIGVSVDLQVAADDLVTRASPRPRYVFTRVGEKILDSLTPDQLESGPKPGSWRQRALSIHRQDRLFTDFLVPVSGEAPGWTALEQAIVLAKMENDRLHGLHVVSSEAEKNSPEALSVKEEFERRCAQAGIRGELVIRAGNVARTICEMACWTDLVVIHVQHPPQPTPAAKLGSGMHTLIRRCCRPILAVPRLSPSIERILLAFDGSPKSMEALFIATYLTGKWQLHLDVLTVLEKGRVSGQTLERARRYLQKYGIQAEFLTAHGDVGEAILQTANQRNSDEIIMGGYGLSPVLEVVLGSAVDRVLRESPIPVLFCR